MNAGQRVGGVFGAVLVFFGALLPAISAPVYGGIPLLQTNIGGILVIATIIGAIAALLGAAAWCG